jgi:hypothetical protein
MPIIINEFEIIPERPAPPTEQAQASAPPQPPQLRPEEIIRVQRLDRERRQRVRAS